MNFKYTYLAGVCALAATGLVSCSSDNTEPVPDNEKVNMAFHISIDDLTRAGDDGTANGNPSTLQYAVFGTNSKGVENSFLFSDQTTGAPEAVKNGDGSFTLNLSLTKNSSFTIAFWAETDDAENEAYVFNRENATVTVNYANAKFNSTAADAFYACAQKDTHASASETANVTLQRPFSQINIGTTSSTDGLDDLLSNTKATSRITLSGQTFPNILNLKEGSVSGKINSIDFTAAQMPAGYTYPVDGYSYIAMGYVLSTEPITILGSEATQETNTSSALSCDITLEILPEGKTTAAFTKTFPGVQLKANTRTNIYGTILDNISEINANINNAFGGETNVPVGKNRR